MSLGKNVREEELKNRDTVETVRAPRLRSGRLYFLRCCSMGQSHYNAGMKTFEIWSEGYAENVGSTPAFQWRNTAGETFRDAVLAYADANSEFKEALDPVALTVWGCRLFPTEAEARVLFG